MIVFDLVVNFWLIGLFIYFLRPTLKLRGQTSMDAGDLRMLTIGRLFNISLRLASDEAIFMWTRSCRRPKVSPTNFITNAESREASDNGGTKLSTASITHEVESSNILSTAPPLPLRLPRQKRPEGRSRLGYELLLWAVLDIK